jgi:hypothetical protein
MAHGMSLALRTINPIRDGIHPMTHGMSLALRTINPIRDGMNLVLRTIIAA